MRSIAVLAMLASLVLLGLLVACQSPKPPTPSAPSPPSLPPGEVGARPTPFAPPSSGAVLPPPPITPQTGLWVVGTGKVTVEPDLALITLGVEARARTAEEARSQAAGAMTAILRTLKTNGIPEKDLQTRLFTISPQHTWHQQSGAQVLTGYVVSSQKAVKVRKLEAVGKVIDDAVKAGGDLVRVQGVHFTIADPSSHYAKARELAVKDARAKAEHFSRLAGVALGKVMYINEMSGVIPMVQEFKSALPVQAFPTPILSGELEVQVSVQVAYALP